MQLLGSIIYITSTSYSFEWSILSTLDTLHNASQFIASFPQQKNRRNGDAFSASVGPLADPTAQPGSNQN